MAQLGSGCGTAAKEKGEIERELDGLHCQLDSLRHVVDELYEKLAPVTRPEPPQCPGDAKTRCDSINTALGTSINSAFNNASGICNNLRELIYRIEL